MLKKKITEIAVAMDSSLALITGAVAAIAEPPQIDDPTPTKVTISLSNLNSLVSWKLISYYWWARHWTFYRTLIS